MSRSLNKFNRTDNSTGTVLIRFLVGSVFLSEGIQKFLFAAAQGAGRFEKIGLPQPEILGPFVGITEIICGTLLLVGLITRLAVVPLIIIIVTAIVTTKIPLLSEEGIWKMLHEGRTDWSMLLGGIFVFLNGAGKWSIDRLVRSGKYK